MVTSIRATLKRKFLAGLIVSMPAVITVLYFGDIVLFNEGDVLYTDIPIEEGIRIMLSGGIAAPSLISESKE